MVIYAKNKGLSFHSDRSERFVTVCRTLNWDFCHLPVPSKLLLDENILGLLDLDLTPAFKLIRV